MTVVSEESYNELMDSAETTLRSYAKVNLTLDVLQKRPDGYHDIESVMQTVSLHDTITLRLGQTPGIRVQCNDPEIPTDERNLAHRAAAVYFEAAGIEPALDIKIEKRIPQQAGLGGGSSNGATVLVGLNRLLEKTSGIPRCDLGALASRVGSDVSFFLTGGTALVRGMGEDVRPVPDIPTWWMVIVKPPFGIPTAWAYRRLDEMRSEGDERSATKRWVSASERLSKCLCEASHPSQCDLPAFLSNDFEEPVIEAYPAICRIMETLERSGARGALLCGSGSAVFGLFDSEEEACRTSAALPEDMGEVFVAHTISREELETAR